MNTKLNTVNYSTVKSSLLRAVILFGMCSGAVFAQTQTEFSWNGKGDGTSWSDAENWNEGVVPTGSGKTWRPDARIDVSGAEVTIGEEVPRFFGNTLVGSVGKGCTLNLVEGGELTTQGGLLIGGKSIGTFNMTGGKLTIMIWGGRDLRIGNGVMNFGSSVAESAPVIQVVPNSRGFSVAVEKGEESVINMSGYGTISTVQRAVFAHYGQATVNVVGGNLNLYFDTKPDPALTSRIGGNQRRFKAIVNYTLDASGASTMNFGGNVEFGVAEFNLSLDKSFSAKPGDVFTIISAAGDFNGEKQFSNVGADEEIAVGGYTFKAVYTCDPNGKDTFTLTVVSGSTVG
jgi:hypothetical protein